MAVNPVLSKEIRQRFHSHKAALMVAGYLLALGSFILGFIYLNWQHRPGYFQPGQHREIFIMLVLAQFALLCFVVPGLTAGLISGEREKQTLNVLLTTRLSCRSIVTGKLAAACLFFILLLAASLPLYSMVSLYGGFAPGQTAASFGIYLLSMYLYGALGVACSVFFQRTGVSTVATYGIAFFLSVCTGLLAIFFYQFLQPPGGYVGELPPLVVRLLLAINPGAVLVAILEPRADLPFAGLGLPYWLIYTLFCLGLGTALLAYSARALNPLRRRGKRFWR